jgi:hypothetical protein
MRSLMETLMVRENPRNCSRRTKHQLSALVIPTTDKPPAQGVHDSNHEGFMMPETDVAGMARASAQAKCRGRKKHQVMGFMVVTMNPS